MITYISKKLKGVFVVNASMLKSPPDNLKIRPISKYWVEVLVKRLRALPQPISTILHVMVDQTDCASPDDFDVAKLSEMTLYTLGGNHIRTAVQQIINLSETNSALPIR